MDSNTLTAIGMFLHAGGFMLDEKDPKTAWTYLLKGLGQFGVHDSIKAALEAPPLEVDAGKVFETKVPESPQ